MPYVIHLRQIVLILTLTVKRRWGWMPAYVINVDLSVIFLVIA